MSTFNSAQIASIINSTLETGTNSDVAVIMDQFKVSPAQVAAAMNAPVSAVQAAYDTATKDLANRGITFSGIYATPTTTTTPTTTPATTTAPTTPSAPLSDFERTLQAAVAVRNATTPTTTTTPTTPTTPTTTGIATLPATTTPTTTTATTAPATTTTTTTPKFTPEQTKKYFETLQELGKTNAEVAADMDKFGVNATQMATALGISPVAVQDAYNIANPKGKYSTVVSKEGIAGFAKPVYEEAKFTGKTGIGTVTPAPVYTTMPLLSTQARGAPGIIGLPAPDVYAGVPAAAARPSGNYPILAGTATNQIADYINYLQSIGSTSADINTALTSQGVTPAQLTAGQTAAATPATTATPMKEGGLAGLAEKVQSAGRHGDTMLAHITPREAGILQALGGSGTDRKSVV